MIKSFINNYEYYENISLKKYNTYKLDVICKYLVFPKNILELTELIRILKEKKIKYLVLGNGSNVIFENNIYEGVIIKLDKINNIKIDNDIVIVEAGYSLMNLARLVSNYNLSGLEFAGGIPGQVGASTAMNAGAYKSSMSEIVKEVKVLNPNLEIEKFDNKKMDFDYRDSFLKKNKDYLCLEVTLKLKKGKEEDILNIMEDRKKRRMESQPLDLPSAGSVFRNPEGFFAGKLVEDVGLKGKSINGIQVSEKHANFIVNTGNGTGKDIVELINIIKKEVKEKYKIDLMLEQEIIR